MTKKFFFFRKDGVLKKINMDEILFLETNDNYVRFYALGYHHLVRTTLDAVMDQLKSESFIKINRSYAVSIEHVVEIDKEYVLIKNYKFALPVSKMFYKELIKRIGIFETVSQESRLKEMDDQIQVNDTVEMKRNDPE